MTSAWETTPDDLDTVLNAHSVGADDDQVEAWFDEMVEDGTCEEIERNVLRYTEFDDQCNSMLDDLENWFIRRGIVRGEKKYYAP